MSGRWKQERERKGDQKNGRLLRRGCGGPGALRVRFGG